MGARQFSSRLLKIVKTVVLLGQRFPVVHVLLCVKLMNIRPGTHAPDYVHPYNPSFLFIH